MKNDNKLIKLVPDYFLKPTEKLQLSNQHLGCPSDAGFVLKMTSFTHWPLLTINDGVRRRRLLRAEGVESERNAHTYNINTNTLQNKSLSWLVESVSRSMHNYRLKVTLDPSSESETSTKLHEKMIRVTLISAYNIIELCNKL